MGEHDPIHVLFHPDRGKLSGAAATVPATSSSPPPLMDAVSLDAPTKAPLRLLLLCSDGPQHSYLRYRLDQAFPGYHCVQETGDGQVQQLWQKGRVVDACWQAYHGWRRRLFGHDRQRRAHFDALVPGDHVLPPPDLVVDSVNCAAVWEAAERWQPQLTIVSGTKFIGKKMFARGSLMLNLHTGHLPEYKGNHCIFFALYDGATDKIAATLHQLTSSLDGGDVLDRVYPAVLPSDDEEALYTRCLEIAINRCVDYIGRFASGKRLDFVPQVTDGRTFRHCDRTPGKELALWWKLNMGGLLWATGKKEI